MLSFKELDKSKLVGLISQKEKDKETIKETIWLNPTVKRKMTQDVAFGEEIQKYAEDIVKNEDGIITSFKMKEGYKLHSTPPNFTTAEGRFVNYICGKSGSGKSYYVKGLLKKYHHMYPKNRIYFISVKDVRKDPSLSDLFKIKSFQKISEQIDLMSFSATLDYKIYNNCLFVFDDIIDVNVPVNPVDIAKEYMEDLITVQKRKNPNVVITAEKLKEDARLLLADQMKINRISKVKSESIKMYILNTLNLFLKVGRENGISLVVTDHKMRSGSSSIKVISESHNVVLFPFGNVSKMKLKEFLEEMLSFDKDVSTIISNNKFIKYEFLNINTSGDNFFMTGNQFKML